MKLRRIGTLLVIIGFLAILSGGAVWLRNYLEERAAAGYSESIAAEFFVSVSPPEASANTEPPPHQPLFVSGSGQFTDDKVVSIDGAGYIGIISIPLLDINLPVNQDWSYPALKKSPCRYSGNIHDNTLVVAAHNYDRHFGNIARLSIGDPVILFCAGGIERRYETVSVETVDPGDTDSVINSGYDLTLFTCTYGGQARVVVRCVLAADGGGGR
jgi:sortase A